MSDSAQPASMSSEQMIEACLKHTMYSWAATGKVAPLPIARAEGVYMWTPDGKRILDFNSQLMSVNVGHSHPKMVEAIKRAAEGLIYVFPGTATQALADQFLFGTLKEKSTEPLPPLTVTEPVWVPRRSCQAWTS